MKYLKRSPGNNSSRSACFQHPVFATRRGCVARCATCVPHDSQTGGRLHLRLVPLAKNKLRRLLADNSQICGKFLRYDLILTNSLIYFLKNVKTSPTTTDAVPTKEGPRASPRKPRPCASARQDSAGRPPLSPRGPSLGLGAPSAKQGRSS